MSGIRIDAVRRFNVKDNGISKNVFARRQLELPMIPQRDMVLALDGADVQIQSIRVRPAGSPPLGIVPCGIEICTQTEPGERLGKALEAGWKRLEAAGLNGTAR